MDHLFVYGTLLSGVANPAMAALMSRMQYLGPANLPGRLHDLGPYPAVVPDPDCPDHVRGELYALPRDPSLLALLDQYEGFFPDRPAQSLFRRVRVGVARTDDRAVHAWVYVWNRDIGNAPVIAEGDYRLARSANRKSG
ncbi:MAG: gamma-glutamylcyclotransferase [Gemmataceae bacterium]|nr:gamma-glutamylcyclotransferase [Gemmataceae bacterium]